MKVLRSITVICFLASVLNAQQWTDYLKDKNKREYLKHSMRIAGTGSVLATNTGSHVLWVTDTIARALVASKIERERISEDEAQAFFKTLRPDGRYTFIIFTRHTGIGGSSASVAVDPLTATELFLQRADDRNVFSKGEISGRDFDVDLSLFGGAKNIYAITFSKLDRNGQPVIKGMDDKIEIQYSLGSKRVVLDYKVKTIAGSLDEL
jgi:hypothetical protein